MHIMIDIDRSSQSKWFIFFGDVSYPVMISCWSLSTVSPCAVKELRPFGKSRSCMFSCGEKIPFKTFNSEWYCEMMAVSYG